MGNASTAIKTLPSEPLDIDELEDSARQDEVESQLLETGNIPTTLDGYSDEHIYERLGKLGDPSDDRTKFKYNTERYKIQKLLKERRSSGHHNLNSLSPRHKKVIKLHLQGYTNRNICEVMEFAPTTVATILSDPKSVQVIDEALEAQRKELAALQRPAIDACRQAMNSAKPSIQLAGVDRFIKLSEYLGIHEEQKTAEDVIEHLMTSFAGAIKNAGIIEDLAEVRQKKQEFKDSIIGEVYDSPDSLNTSEDKN